MSAKKQPKLISNWLLLTATALIIPSSENFALEPINKGQDAPFSLSNDVIISSNKTGDLQTQGYETYSGYIQGQTVGQTVAQIGTETIYITSQQPNTLSKTKAVGQFTQNGALQIIADNQPFDKNRQVILENLDGFSYRHNTSKYAPFPLKQTGDQPKTLATGKEIASEIEIKAVVPTEQIVLTYETGIEYQFTPFY